MPVRVHVACACVCVCVRARNGRPSVDDDTVDEVAQAVTRTSDSSDLGSTSVRVKLLVKLD